MCMCVCVCVCVFVCVCVCVCVCCAHANIPTGQNIVQWNLLIRTLENEDTYIVWTLGKGPKVFLSV